MKITYFQLDRKLSIISAGLISICSSYGQQNLASSLKHSQITSIRPAKEILEYKLSAQNTSRRRKLPLPA